MKDGNASKRSRRSSDGEGFEENDTKRGSPNNKTEKQKRKKMRKRRSSSSPEEDVIDGFVIASYSSLRSLEVVSSNTPDSPPPLLAKKQDEQVAEEPSRIREVQEELPRPPADNNKVVVSKISENGVTKESRNGKDLHTEVEARRSPGQMSDDSSDSGNSGKGYICDGESEDELAPQEKTPKSTLITSVPEAKKEVAQIKVDLSKDEEPLKNEKYFKTGLDIQRTIPSSPKSTSFHVPSLSFSSSSSLSISQSRPVISQSSWPLRLSSSFQKPLVEPCCSSGPYAGADALHQELNNRFLQSHSELERNSQHSKPAGHEMHQHSHLHHHQHQHQHTHYYPPLLATPYFPTPSPTVPSVLSPFSSPVPTYGSHVISPYNKKTGKWCAAHVQIAWKIYCHQRVQTEMSKDPHVKPEQISISKPSTTAIIPPFSARHVSPNELGYHSPHLHHSSRFSGSPFGKPPLLIGRGSASSTAATSSISAFSSVSSPPAAARPRVSPVIIPPSRVSSSSEIFGKRSPTSGPSTLYPWLKSEPRPLELDSEKSNKREFLTRSPTRPSNNFSIQALAGERSEAIRRSPLEGLDSTRIHSSREHRPCETRSFLDNPLVPSLISGLDKRPVDYRPSAGSIDLNRNSLYPRFDPMHALYSHHVTPLTPHVSGYHYPGSSFLADYHSGVGAPPGMVLGTRDPMPSLVRNPDAPFYIRHDRLEERMGSRH